MRQVGGLNATKIITVSRPRFPKKMFSQDFKVKGDYGKYSI
jgi:hypothetical protein